MERRGIRIAVLALQGAFIEHERMLSRLGVDAFEVRQWSDWDQPKDGLIIPGGESTTMTKLLHDLHLYTPIRQAIENGLPVFGTCAGLILLAKRLVPHSFPEEEGRGRHVSDEEPYKRLATMDIEVVRNAYGRQLGSFYTEALFLFDNTSATSNLKSQSSNLKFPLGMTFIRAPYINKVYGKAEVLATVDGHIVAARQENQLVTAFHPELNEDLRVHEYFLNIVKKGGC